MGATPTPAEIEARFRAIDLKSAHPVISETLHLRVAGISICIKIDAAWNGEITPLLRTYWSPFLASEAKDGVEIVLSPADVGFRDSQHPLWNSPHPFTWKVEDATGPWIFHRDFLCRIHAGSFQIWLPRPTANSTDGLDNVIGFAARTLAEKRQTFLFHAAVIEHREKAVVLFGPSGIGKSTVARASREWGYRVMASDQVYLRLGDGQLWAEASPTMNPDIPRCPLSWATGSLEVKALFALKRTDQFEIHGMDRAEFARVFFSEIFVDELESAHAQDFMPALDFASRVAMLKGVTRGRLSYPKGWNFWPTIEELEYV